jgi:hypothetical protein|tara:strand:- start:246 stop:413 length:168 start_codon:yes stop_codon:yes gene_type:complete
MTNVPKNPCITLEQSVQLKRLTEELTAMNNAKKYKRMKAIEEHQNRKKNESEDES